MATLKVTLKNNFFTATNNAYLDRLEPTHVEGNGWDCRILSDGSIRCICEREYSDGTHSMWYCISPLGYAKLTLKVPEKPVKILKKGWVLPKGRKLADCGLALIGLAGGYVDFRYGYFRNSDFQNFLIANNLTSVRHEDPNDVYTIRNAGHGGGYCHSRLYTDGKTEQLATDFGRSIEWMKEYPNTSSSELEETIKVRDSTWVIVSKERQEHDKRNYSRILYTLEDLGKLTNLPKD